jgi:hypothetical protein
MGGGLCLCALDNSLKAQKMIKFLIDNKKSLTAEEIEDLDGDDAKLKRFVAKLKSKVQKELTPPEKKIFLADVVVYEIHSPKLKG